MNIPLPQQLTGSDREQLQGMKTYLFQLAQELQFALGSVEKQILTVQDTAANADREVSRISESQTPKAQFSALKALIIKSADIVEAYYEEINRRLSGQYLAISDFGTYRQETEQVITENSQGITRVFSDVQTISTSLGQTQADLGDLRQETQQGLQSNADAISLVNTSVQTFETSLGQAQSDIQGISTSVSQAQADIQGISASVSQTQSNVDDLNTSLGQAQADIQTIDASVAKAQSDIQTIGTSVSQVQTDIQGINTTVNQAQSDISGINSSLDQAQSDIRSIGTSVSQAQSEIQTINTSVSKAQSDIQTIDASVSQAQSDIQNMDASLSRAQDDISTIGVSVSQAQTDIQGINTSLGQAQSDIHGISDSLGQAQSDIQAMDASLGKAQDLIAEVREAVIQVNAWIKTGKLAEDENSVPIYGVEIGQQTEKNGLVVFQKFARLLADRLSFFDQNGNEVSFIGDETMHITKADISSLAAGDASMQQLRMGEYLWFTGADGHLTLS